MKVSCHDKNWLELSVIEIVETDKDQYENKLTDWVQSDECATKCKESLVQAENSKVTIKCINSQGKKKTMSCSDKNGNLLSTKTGKIGTLIKWVKSYECDPDFDPTRKLNKTFQSYIQFPANPSISGGFVETHSKRNFLVNYLKWPD